MNESDPFFFFSKFCAIWRDFGEEWAQWGWATPGPFWGCCVCQGEESLGGRGSDKTLGSVWELCCCVWMWGWVMFWACAEFGLWQVPGRYFVFCHSCLWFVQEFRVGGSGEIQDFYLTCNFGLFPEKKNSCPPSWGAQAFSLWLFSGLEQNCCLLAMCRCGKMILQVPFIAMCVVLWWYLKSALNFSAGNAGTVPGWWPDPAHGIAPHSDSFAYTWVSQD